jgi:hypothetical protein
MGWQDPLDAEDDDDDYFAEAMDDTELTGLEPRFVKIDSMSLVPVEIDGKRVDELIEMYIKARNQLATDRKGYKAREAKVKLHLQMISMVLMNKADQVGGVDTLATDKGTAYRKIKETFSVSNWEDLCAYVKLTGNFSVLQKRVSPNAVKEVREQEGELPGGVEPRVEVEFAVRSPTASRKSKSVG